MLSTSFISDAVYVANSKAKGRGVYTNKGLEANVVIEIAAVIVMSAKDRKLLDQTLLHDYIGEYKKTNVAWPLGMFHCIIIRIIPIVLTIWTLKRRPLP
jgi:hypothetical protein